MVQSAWSMTEYGGKMEKCAGVWRPVGGKADVAAVTTAQKRKKIVADWSQ